MLAAEEVRRFGITPKVALLSHSNFGTSDLPSARKMRRALALIGERAPDLEVDGEMHGDAALSEEIAPSAFPNSRLKGEANLLIMPTLDAANISFNLLKMAAGDGITIGPILLGAARPVHILTPVGDGAAHRQHDRADGGRREHAAPAVALVALRLRAEAAGCVGASTAAAGRSPMPRRGRRSRSGAARPWRAMQRAIRSPAWHVFR